MDIDTEREIHQLTLDAIVSGRLLAEDWLEGSLAPTGTAKALILETLRSLRERESLPHVDRDLIEAMGEQIRNALNEIRDGKGDAALSREVDLVWEQNQQVIEYANLACRWRRFKEAMIALDDRLAATRMAGLLLASVV
ncbi:hypothetical protein SAMN05444279_12136 [Ruegeria intermedia]|uniref:Uncharacterized protein n=1 Tax=Ruegeria intermedia TaxID=996115 RepID=A0A1M4ZSX9_9RHOB|nr:hypothetical protein [Ruegeria intermedia]SHF20656.1 hypothetical protein SAMN05444279_12136 [Ruegeria intermedia]